MNIFRWIQHSPQHENFTVNQPIHPKSKALKLYMSQSEVLIRDKKLQQDPLLHFVYSASGQLHLSSLTQGYSP